MNENIDLTKILKDCPIGWEFYSSIYGNVNFRRIENNTDCPIVFFFIDKDGITMHRSVTKQGLDVPWCDGECTFFPSRDQRDWSKFTAPWFNKENKKERFDPKTLKVFDKVLARIGGGDVYCWFADFVSTPTIEKYDLLPCIMSNKDANMIIPYNDDTNHLVGTTEEAPEYYRYWEE